MHHLTSGCVWVELKETSRKGAKKDFGVLVRVPRLPGGRPLRLCVFARVISELQADPLSQSGWRSRDTFSPKNVRVDDSNASVKSDTKK